MQHPFLQAAPHDGTLAPRVKEWPMICSIPAPVSRRRFLAGSAAAGVFAFARVARAQSAGAAPDLGGEEDLPVSSPTGPLRAGKGAVRVLSGPGLGLVFDSDFVRAARVVES